MSKNERKEAMAELLENIQLSHFEEMENQRGEIAQQLGLSSDDIDIDLSIAGSELAKQGVIVEVNIGRARFEIEANAKDLGLNTEDQNFKEFLEEYVKMGKLLLMPHSIQRKLNKLETQARRTLERYGYKITRYGCFVPFQVTDSQGKTYYLYNELKEKLDEIKEEYFRVRDEEILDRYEMIRFSTYRKYAEAAQEVYRTRYKDPYCAVPDEFVEKFTNKIMRLFPSKEEIHDQHKFDINLRAVGSPGNASQLNAPPEVQEEMKKTAIREANDFVSDIMVQLRSMMYDAVSKARECVQKHGRLQGPNVTSLKKMVDKINSLNFMNDKQVNDQLKEINEMLERDAEERDSGELHEMLSEIAEENHRILLSLGHQPRRKRGTTEIVDTGETPEPKDRKKRRRNNSDDSKDESTQKTEHPQPRAKRNNRTQQTLFDEQAG